MIHRRAARLALLMALLPGSIGAGPGPWQPRRSGSSDAAYRIVDLESGRTVMQSRPDLLDSPVAPGSIYKIATLIAASESAVVDPHTAILCRRSITVAGTRLTCVHPDLHRALSPVDALAYSCNYFFATIAARLPRAALDGVLARLGLAPIPAGTSTVLGADGLGAVRATPADLLRALVRVAGPVPSFRMTDETRRLVLDGLQSSARTGTSSSFGKAGLLAFAKTGTAPMPGGGSLGIVVAILPQVMPRLGIVVVAPGGAGSDAAEIASGLLTQHLGGGRGRESTQEVSEDPPAGMRIRIGETTALSRWRVREWPLEAYVAQVVAGESPDTMHPAAREALAIAARTFALASLGRHQAEGFDLCDLTHCQAIAKSTPAAERAASATRGLVLLHNGRPAEVFFSAWCGGHTERPSAVWPGAIDPPFLPAQPDPACARREAWTSEVPAPRLLAALHSAGLKGQSLRGFRVVDRTGSGRAQTLRAVGLVPEELPAGHFRMSVGRILGWQWLKSTWFDVRPSAAGVVFVGRGSGHGVGLCLVGADQRASEGADARSILAFYFPGLPIGQQPASTKVRPGRKPSTANSIRMLLPDADLSQLPATRELATQILDDLSARLGVDPPGSVTVRFHPTAASYRAATGKPWWVAGSTSGRSIDLLPLDVLRGRRILESTLRHEMVHVLTDLVLAGRPLWVREGLAASLAGETQENQAAGGLSVPRSSACPRDEEFSRESTPEASRDAYSRASACVARWLAAGRSWRDLR
jgi:SpoIID/LytB domain protein